MGRMAAAMRAAVGELSNKWRKLGVGIAHSYATLGRIGFEGRFDYAAIGSVTNLAVRLCAEAKDVQILIGGKVQAAVEAIAELEPLEALTLKGFHRQVSTSNVRAISP
jgi:adenylate cyclase